MTVRESFYILLVNKPQGGTYGQRRIRRCLLDHIHMGQPQINNQAWLVREDTGYAFLRSHWASTKKLGMKKEEISGDCNSHYGAGRSQRGEKNWQAGI